MTDFLEFDKFLSMKLINKRYRRIFAGNLAMIDETCLPGGMLNIRQRKIVEETFPSKEKELVYKGSEQGFSTEAYN